MTDCPLCATPSRCVYNHECQGCTVRMIARMPVSAANAWMTDALRPLVDAERKRLADTGAIA